MRPKFPRIFAAECKRISWINTAGDDTHESFVFVWLRSWNLFNFQYIRRAVLMRDNRFHQWLVLGEYEMRKEHQNRDT